MTRRIASLILISTAITAGRIPVSYSAPTALNIFSPVQAGTNMNGNSSFVPFDNPGRFQQVFDSSDFGPLSIVGGGWIRQVIFRVDAGIGHTFEATVRSIQLNVSTTPRAPDSLSPVFVDNVGSDDTIILGPSSLRLSGSGGNGFTGFGVLFDFPELPFFYNPANGNLLLDFRIYQGIGPIGPPQGVAVLDAYNVSRDSVSSVYAFLDVNSPTGLVSSLGLATDFVFFPVPELTVSLQSSNLLFRWVNQQGGFTLQQSATIGSGASWQPAGGIVTTNGAYREVTLPLDSQAAARFFRLILPPSSPGSPFMK